MEDTSSSAGQTGSGSLSPEEAFALLGNKTRVDILQALWGAFESGPGGDAVPYSTLFERVDVEDSGNFSYHLEKLTGPFVRKTGDGYELKQTGVNVIRAVVAGTVTQDPTFGPAPVDADCPLCGAPIEVTYDDEVMDVCCSACEGRIRWKDRPGHVFGALVPPVAIEGQSIEAAFRAAVVYTLHRIAAFHDGVCAHCSGPVETSVTVCEDHAPGDGTHCPACDRTNMSEVWWGCATCKLGLPPPVSLVVLDDPDVTAFYNERGIEHRFATWETVVRSFEVGEELLSGDPLRMRYAIPAGDDELRLTLDGELNVIDVTP